MWPLFALAVAPGLAISIYIYWKDKYDPEPRKLLLLSFVLGLVSVIPALILEVGIDKLGIIYSNSVARTAVYSFIGVAFIEEAAKFFFVFRYLYPKKDFDEPFDGITYAVLVSMGFATLENVAYSINGGTQVAVMRMFTAVPAHAAFGVIMGYFMGMAKFDHNRSNSLLAMSLFAPAILHAAYDFPLLLNPDLLPWFKQYRVLGAIVSLGIGLLLSFRAIRLHQHNSPFKPKK